MSQSIKYLLVSLLGTLALIFFFLTPAKSTLPTIAIANWGPHASLDDTVKGIKEGLAAQGYRENEQIRFEIKDVNFEPTLILSMHAALKASNPKVIVALSTPVAQAAKASIKNIPLIYSSVTEPHAVGLQDIPGASDRQNLLAFLSFAKKILPEAKRIGILYSTAEANDAVLVSMMQQAAKQHDMTVVALPIEQTRDIPLRMQAFKNKVDFIYVGVSGAIQPSLPAICAVADQMKIPVFNAESEAVKNHQALGSFGVSYYQVGVNTANIIAKVLKGEDIASLGAVYPTLADHVGFISRKRAQAVNIILPSNLDNIEIVE